MKNTLLTTTALALTSFASTASAVEISTGAVTLKISGSFKTTVAASNVKIGAGTTDNKKFNSGDDFDGVDILTNSEIHFKPSITLDNGITIGADIELEGNTSSDQIDESTIFAAGAFGKVELGSKDSAGKLMQVYAPDVSMVYANSTSLTSFVPFDGPTTVPDFAGDAERLTYFTPDFGGFQLGVSYARNNSQTSGAVNNNEAGIGTDYADIGISYGGTVGEVTVAFSARYGTYDRAMGVNAALTAANTAQTAAIAAQTAAQTAKILAIALTKSAVGEAQTAVTAAAAADAAAQTALTAATTALTAAQTAADADGADGADATALTAALTAAQTALTVQTAAAADAATVQTAAAAALGLATTVQTAAQTALTAAQTALTDAQTAADAAAADAAAQTALTDANTALTAAQTALTDAQTALTADREVVTALTDAATVDADATTALGLATTALTDANTVQTAAAADPTAAAAADAAHPTVAGVGLSLGFGGFSIGGGYVEVNEKTGLSKAKTYDIGVSYATGPMGYSLTYVKGKTSGNTAESTSMVAAATYTLNPNFKVGASLASVETDMAGSTAGDIKGTVFALSAQFNF